ncbi:MAG: DUF4349 domain-containing protein, partial [Demequina sp.]|uniref:DUF4349 domain-containing protein n=1 Tax=Demequina sp. TaxID=2050685 RepID=UPI003A88F7E5
MITRTDAGSRPLRTGVAVVALAALAWLLAGCSSSDGGGDSASAMAYSEAEMADGGGESEDVMSGSAQDADSAEGYAADTDRAVIITGSMFMTVDDPVAAATKAETIVRAAGGRVDARNEIAPSDYDGGSAWMTLRIPAGDLDGVVTNLRGLGTVDEYSTDSADVTNEVTDLEAQISTLKNSTERIEALLLEAEAIKDIITLENELDGRQAELESLEARQRGLNDQVAMSTIELSLTTEPVVEVDDSPASFLDGLESGWNGLVNFLAGALVVVGVLLPWAVVAGVVAVVVVLAVRARRKRHPRRPGGVASAAQTPQPLVPTPASADD